MSGLMKPEDWLNSFESDKEAIMEYLGQKGKVKLTSKQEALWDRLVTIRKWLGKYGKQTVMGLMEETYGIKGRNQYYILAEVKAIFNDCEKLERNLEATILYEKNVRLAAAAEADGKYDAAARFLKNAQEILVKLVPDNEAPDFGAMNPGAAIMFKEVPRTFLKDLPEGIDRTALIQRALEKAKDNNQFFNLIKNPTNIQDVDFEEVAERGGN
jgi:hypothetical protein